MASSGNQHCANCISTVLFPIERRRGSTAIGLPNTHARTHTHTHTRLMALCPGLPGWAGTRKVKPIWILLKQETVSGSGISWAICKSAPRFRQITTQFFTGRMPFLPPNQQHHSTEGTARPTKVKHNTANHIDYAITAWQWNNFRQHRRVAWFMCLSVNDEHR